MLATVRTLSRRAAPRLPQLLAAHPQLQIQFQPRLRVAGLHGSRLLPFAAGQLDDFGGISRLQEPPMNLVRLGGSLDTSR